MSAALTGRSTREELLHPAVAQDDHVINRIGASDLQARFLAFVCGHGQPFISQRVQARMLGQAHRPDMPTGDTMFFFSKETDTAARVWETGVREMPLAI